MDTTDTVYICIAAYAFTVLASIGGIGGGGMLIPVFAMITDIPIKDAIVLSIVTITGSALVRGIYFSFKRHNNNKSRFLPNYELIRLVIPFDGNVSFLGLMLNEVSPNIVIFGLVFIVLSVMIFKIIQKSYKMFKKDETTSFITIIYDNIEQEHEVSESDYIEDQIEDQEERKLGESWKYVVDSLLYVLFTMSIIIFFTFVRDSYEGSKRWLIWTIQFIVILLFCYNTIRNIQLQYNFRKKANFNFIKGDIAWNRNEDGVKSFIKYGLAGSSVGIISTMLGIGGGMILNPVMIQFGIEPDVVLASSSIMTFFSSTTSSIQYLATGDYNQYKYTMIALFLVGIFGGSTALIILKFFRQKIKKMVVLVLLICLVVSLVLLSIYSVHDIVDNGITTN